jgi:hypothetical protein
MTCKTQCIESLVVCKYEQHVGSLLIPNWLLTLNRLGKADHRWQYQQPKQGSIASPSAIEMMHYSTLSSRL